MSPSVNYGEVSASSFTQIRVGFLLRQKKKQKKNKKTNEKTNWTHRHTLNGRLDIDDDDFINIIIFWMLYASFL